MSLELTDLKLFGVSAPWLNYLAELPGEISGSNNSGAKYNGEAIASISESYLNEINSNQLLICCFNFSRSDGIQPCHSLYTVHRFRPRIEMDPPKKRPKYGVNRNVTQTFESLLKNLVMGSYLGRWRNLPKGNVVINMASQSTKPLYYMGNGSRLFREKIMVSHKNQQEQSLQKNFFRIFGNIHFLHFVEKRRKNRR